MKQKTTKEGKMKTTEMAEVAVYIRGVGRKIKIGNAKQIRKWMKKLIEKYGEVDEVQYLNTRPTE